MQQRFGHVLPGNENFRAIEQSEAAQMHIAHDFGRGPAGGEEPVGPVPLLEVGAYQAQVVISDGASSLVLGRFERFQRTLVMCECLRVVAAHVRDYAEVLLDPGTQWCGFGAKLQRVPETLLRGVKLAQFEVEAGQRVQRLGSLHGIVRAARGAFAGPRQCPRPRVFLRAVADHGEATERFGMNARLPITLGP